MGLNSIDTPARLLFLLLLGGSVACSGTFAEADDAPPAAVEQGQDAGSHSAKVQTTSSLVEEADARFMPSEL
jgi:hypothetical protein